MLSYPKESTIGTCTGIVRARSMKYVKYQAIVKRREIDLPIVCDIRVHARLLYLLHECHQGTSVNYSTIVPVTGEWPRDCLQPALYIVNGYQVAGFRNATV